MDPNPINLSHLSVHELPARQSGSPSGPFVYDKGTATVHLGDQGYLAPAQVREHPLVSPHLRGPLYSGYLSGGATHWITRPGQNDAASIASTLGRHLGQPVVDESRLASLRCPTCGDPIATPECPRCDWGRYQNVSEDGATTDPIDPTTDVKSDFIAQSSMNKNSDYNGWSNWDTWHTKLLMDNDYKLYQAQEKMAQEGWSPEQIRDWAVTHAIGPYNKQQMADAREWNEIPEHDRLDHNYESLKEKNPEAADMVNGLGFGPDVSDTEPNLMDPELINWNEIHHNINSDYRENQNYERQQQGLPPLPPYQAPQPQIQVPPVQQPQSLDQPGNLTIPEHWSKVEDWHELPKWESCFDRSIPQNGWYWD